MKSVVFIFESSFILAKLCKVIFVKSFVHVFKSLHEKDLFFRSKRDVIEIKEKAFLDLSELQEKIFYIIDKKRPKTNPRLRNAYLQRVFIRLEESYIFLELVKIQSKTAKIYCSSMTKWLAKRITDHKTVNISSTYAFASKIFAKTLLIIKIFYSAIQTLTTFFQPQVKINHNIRYAIGDIAPSDHAVEANQKDFMWPIQSNLFFSDETLFILNTPASKETMSWVEKHNAQVIFVGDIEKILPFKMKVLLLKDYLVLSFLSLLQWNDFLLICLDWDVKTKKWEYLWRELKPLKYFSSTSTLRNESPQTSICDLCNVEAINWAYANNELQFSNHDEVTQDLTIKSSIFSTHKIFIWDNKVKDLLAKRRIPRVPYPDFFKIGPLMFGDHGVLKFSMEEALEKMGVYNFRPDQIVISFFEDPVVSSEVERNLLIYRPIEEREIIDTFKMLYNLLNRFSDVTLIFKGKKRDFMKNYNSKVLNDLLNHQRCFVVEPIMNQYLPFLASDMAISLPISSAIDLASFFGIPGYHYYPTQKIFGTFQDQYKESIVRKEEIIFDKVVDLKKNLDIIREKKKRMIADINIVNNIKLYLNQ